MKLGRLILIEVLVVVILGLLGLGGYYLYWQGQHYISTDNAQLSGNLVPVVATAPGQINGSLPGVGSRVSPGQDIFQEKVSLPQSAATGAAGAHAAPASVTVNVAAPAAGRIAQVSVVDGQYVQPGTPLATIVSTSGNTVVANIPETQISSVKVGQTVDVTIDAYPSDTFPGHVAAIVPATQASLSLLPSTQSSGNYTKVTQLVPVIIHFENPDGATLYVGLNVEVRIHTSGS